MTKDKQTKLAEVNAAYATIVKLRTEDNLTAIESLVSELRVEIEANNLESGLSITDKILSETRRVRGALNEACRGRKIIEAPSAEDDY